jgi:hypothetical protein
MGDPEAFPGSAVHEAARDLVARREGDGMHEDVERIPGRTEARERGIDLRIDAHVHGQDDRAGEVPRHSRDTLAQAFPLVGEGELRSLPMHRRGDPVGDRTLRREADDQGTLAAQEPHRVNLR